MSKDPNTLILPPGIAVFPKLNEVDVYTPRGGKEQRNFKTYVRYEPKVLKDVQDRIVEWGKTNGVKKGTKLPFKELKSKNGDPELVFSASSGEKYRPALFDAKNKKLPPSVEVSGGSIIRPNVTLKYYDLQGGVIKAYLNQVQVIKLVSNNNSVSAFEEEDGFSYESADETSSFSATDDDTSGEDDPLTL